MPMSTNDRPDLSIVMTIVDGEAALVRALEALRRQTDPPILEIIVPFDDTIADTANLAPRFPEVRFVPLGSLSPPGVALGPFAQHAIYDRRRAGGLRAATGRLVAMLEDRGLPRNDWARAMVGLHDASPRAVIGGAIANGATGSLRWALFFCDFGRFQPPLEQDDAEYVTDINICYRSDAIESVRELWEDRFLESRVNWALRRRGNKLQLSDKALVVHERAEIGLGAVLRERIGWGRVFGQVRGRETTPMRCLIWAAVSPVIPLVLFTRHFRRQLAKGHHLREFVQAMPAMLLLLHCWVLGEFVGYLDAARIPRAPAAGTGQQQT
jgi:hypothetical protein